MKNIVKLLLFFTYSTLVFFFKNNYLILLFILINSVLMLIKIKEIRKILYNTSKLIPFILFTFVINTILDSIPYAFWTGLKLFIVCNATFIYSSTTSTLEIANTIKTLCTPLKLLKVDTNDIKILVCISLSLVPIIQKELVEIKESCKAKNMKFNVKNMKYILSKAFISLIKRVNNIEEALIEKGYLLD